MTAYDAAEYYLKAEAAVTAALAERERLRARLHQEVSRRRPRCAIPVSGGVVIVSRTGGGTEAETEIEWVEMVGTGGAR